jgi:hypothetical protein
MFENMQGTESAVAVPQERTFLNETTLASFSVKPLVSFL